MAGVVDTAAMLVRGERGVATRYPVQALRGDAFPVDGAVDAWKLRPNDTSPDFMLVCVAGLDSYAVLVVRVHDDVLRLATEMELDRGLASDVFVFVALTVNERWQAREVTRHLARAAVMGAVPIRPTNPDLGRQWELTTATLEAIVRKMDRELKRAGKEFVEPYDVSQTDPPSDQLAIAPGS